MRDAVEPGKVPEPYGPVRPARSESLLIRRVRHAPDLLLVTPEQSSDCPVWEIPQAYIAIAAAARQNRAVSRECHAINGFDSARCLSRIWPVDDSKRVAPDSSPPAAMNRPSFEIATPSTCDFGSPERTRWRRKTSFGPWPWIVDSSTLAPTRSQTATPSPPTARKRPSALNAMLSTAPDLGRLIMDDPAG